MSPQRTISPLHRRQEEDTTKKLKVQEAEDDLDMIDEAVDVDSEESDDGLGSFGKESALDGEDAFSDELSEEEEDDEDEDEDEDSDSDGEIMATDLAGVRIVYDLLSVF